mmetsp:Transcript_24403/g.56715  ORF Transcript_24403/g.56715 Transcript_24403/m.56715 type:complete len:232 (-) Transcript_24403:1561-2256(-)
MGSKRSALSSNLPKGFLGNSGCMFKFKLSRGILKPCQACSSAAACTVNSVPRAWAERMRPPNSFASCAKCEGDCPGRLKVAVSNCVCGPKANTPSPNTDPCHNAPKPPMEAPKKSERCLLATSAAKRLCNALASSLYQRMRWSMMESTSKSSTSNPIRSSCTDPLASWFSKCGCRVSHPSHKARNSARPSNTASDMPTASWSSSNGTDGGSMDDEHDVVKRRKIFSHSGSP